MIFIKINRFFSGGGVPSFFKKLDKFSYAHNFLMGKIKLDEILFVNSFDVSIVTKTL